MIRKLPILVLSLAACSLQKIAVDQTAGILAVAGRAFDREQDVELARAAIPASLKTAEGFLEAHESQRQLLRIVAEGYMNYAFGFLEDEAEAAQAEQPDKAEALRQRARDLHLRARGFGLRLLALEHPELSRTLADKQLPSDAELAEVGSDGLEGLFWTASPWGAAINAGKDDPALLAELPIVSALMERCAQIDETFYKAGPAMTLGALAAGLPKALGGDPKKATVHFQRAIELTHGNFLMARVLFARTVGVQSGDRALFEKELRAVLAHDPDSVPELALANRLAQRRAARYLNDIELFFLE